MSVTALVTFSPHHRRTAMSRLAEANALSKKKSHRKLAVHARPIPIATQQATANPFMLATALRASTGGNLDVFA